MVVVVESLDPSISSLNGKTTRNTFGGKQLIPICKVVSHFMKFTWIEVYFGIEPLFTLWRGKTWEYPKEQRKRKKLDFAITKVNINFVCAFSLFSQSEQSAWKSSEKGLIFSSLILIMHLYKYYLQYILTQKYNGLDILKECRSKIGTKG